MVALHLLLPLLGACSDPSLPPGDPSRPDLVLVSIDTLRADHLSSYGYARSTSPFLDELASSGVRFTHARSPSPWTLPAHATMLSGLDVLHHGVVEDNLSLRPEVPVLPEMMKAADFATAGFVATFYVSRKFGFERGFDHFEDFDISSGKENLEKNVPAKKVVGAALRWLSKQPAGRPVFLFVHLYDVHYPYEPPAPHRTLFDRSPRGSDLVYKNYLYYQKHPVKPEQMAHQLAQYDEAIHYVDDQLRRLHSAFSQAGRKATWTVTADHGEEFGERGSWGHAHTLYQEQLHVPLIVSGEGIDPGRVVDQVVGLVDIAPTLAALAGQRLTSDGVDLRGAFRGEAPAPRAFVAETSRFKTSRMSLFEAGWRLDLDLREGSRELYNLGEDPAEKKNLLSQEPDRVADLETRLLSLAGTPWRALRDVKLHTPGIFVRDASLAGRNMEIQEGGQFQVLPIDSLVSLGEEGKSWKASGKKAPAPGDPVSVTGVSGEVGISLEERKRLEALGYIE